MRTSSGRNMDNGEVSEKNTSEAQRVGSDFSTSKNSGKDLESTLESPNLSGYNFADTPIFPSNSSPQSPLTIPSPNHPLEQKANRVEEAVSQKEFRANTSFLEPSVPKEKTKLSTSAKNYFRPHVGAAADQANFHVDGKADELAKLSRAKGLAYGNDIYIPQKNFAPETSKGRALIGHELTHVGQSQSSSPQLFRDEEEPHYPTAEEQKRIEKILGRERVATTVVREVETESGEIIQEESVEMLGKNLTPEERIALANELMGPLNSTMDGMMGESELAADVKTDDDLYALAERAKTEIDAMFGRYYKGREFTLTRIDTSNAERKKNNEILVKGSNMSDAGASLARTIASNFCTECASKLDGLNSESKRAVTLRMAQLAVTERPEFWERAAKLRVGGSYNHYKRTIKLPYSGANLYHSTVHELMHALAHPAFRAAYGDEDLANEGFTEYFARQVEAGTSYPEQVRKVGEVKSNTSGPFLFDYDTGGSAEESLRLAYFSGRLDLIGWQPTSDGERDAVAAAGGAPEWDPEKAKESAAAYEAAAVEEQDAHDNILGMGVYFNPTSAGDPTFTVSYARVLADTGPYSRGRLLLEGQIMGSPVQDPKVLGGSIGLIGEYQEPFFYANGGARFIGGATTMGDDVRVDFSPFVGLGVRAWQTVRVGAEGFVLVPLVGEGVQPGVAGKVTVEF